MLQVTLAVAALTQIMACGAEVGQWEVFETSFETTKQYVNAYTDVEVNVTFRQGDKQWIMPAFWAGGGKWTVRFAPPAKGMVDIRGAAGMRRQNMRQSLDPGQFADGAQVGVPIMTQPGRKGRHRAAPKPDRVA